MEKSKENNTYSTFIFTRKYKKCNMQKELNFITKVLNVCYISINAIDILRISNKINVLKKVNI